MARLPLSRALRGESCNGVELVVKNRIHPDGFFVAVSSRPLREAQRAFRGGVMAPRDVT